MRFDALSEAVCKAKFEYTKTKRKNHIYAESLFVLLNLMLPTFHNCKNLQQTTSQLLWLDR